MSMTLILLYEAAHSRGWRRTLILVVTLMNTTIIIATANRGSFLVLLAGLLGFMFLFRARLGFTRILQIFVAVTVVLVGTTMIVATYTEFGHMFERLTRTTEMDDGLPATRAASWPIAWENIQKKPLLGHGPKLVQRHERRFRQLPPEQLVSRYPHNLYLYLLVTVGILGASCMLFFFGSVAWRIHQGAKRGQFSGEYDKGLVVVGLLVVVAFLVDELKIEFLRSGTVDYAHFVFALFGIFLGWADSARAKARAEVIAPKPKLFMPVVEKGLSSAAQGRTRTKQAG